MVAFEAERYLEAASTDVRKRPQRAPCERANLYSSSSYGPKLPGT